MLWATAQAPIVQNRIEPDCGNYLRRLQNVSPSTTSISLFDLNGQWACSNGPPVSIADRAYFQRAAASDDFIVGEYTIGKTSTQAVLPFAQRIKDRTRASARRHGDDAATGLAPRTVRRRNSPSSPSIIPYHHRQRWDHPRSPAETGPGRHQAFRIHLICSEQGPRVERSSLRHLRPRTVSHEWSDMCGRLDLPRGSWWLWAFRSIPLSLAWRRHGFATSF